MESNNLYNGSTYHIGTIHSAPTTGKMVNNCAFIIFGNFFATSIIHLCWSSSAFLPPSESFKLFLVPFTQVDKHRLPIIMKAVVFYLHRMGSSGF